MKKVKKKYKVCIVKNEDNYKPRWNVVLKFNNNNIFMESEYYVNEVCCRKAGERLYQGLKKGWT